MGLTFGNLYKLYGIVTYQVSPMHLKAFHGVLSHGFPNMIRRCLEEAPYVVPSFALGIATFYGIDYLHAQSARKKPGQFDDEEDE